MSVASPILICPRVKLRALPDRDRDVLRQFFTEQLTGMDADHDREWRRLVRDWFNAEPGEGFQLYRAEERDGPFHRRHRAIVGALFAQQEVFWDLDMLHDWLKLKCWHVEWEDGKPVPASTSFDDCSEARVRKFNFKLVHLLQQPWLQRRFWPHLNASQRAEMVDFVLTNPKDLKE